MLGTLKSILFILLLCCLPFISNLQPSTFLAANSNIAANNEHSPTSQNTAVAAPPISSEETPTTSFQGGAHCVLRAEPQALHFSESSQPPSFTRHMMCKNHDSYYNPINPTTIFRPSDTKAECLTTVTINDTIEFRWFYRSNSSKAWISCYNWSERALSAGEYGYAGYLLITGYWPGTYYPRAYRVEIYLDGQFSFLEFFEVTNGGLNSPRTCEGVDANGHPINVKSRFTIGTDTMAFNYLSFENIAYFNEELECCHNFTTLWIQPDGSIYKTFSREFADYKDSNITWNSWKNGYVIDDSILINSSTPAGNWKVEVHLDYYYLNGTLVPYGPVSTTPFIIGNAPVADWTFMVYLDADNSLESAAIDTFLNLASVGSSSQVNIVAQMDRIGIDDRYGNWTDCKRFKITKDMTPTLGNANMTLGEANMGDPETLKDFINWTLSDYPANHYSLVLWDHGAGFLGFCFDVTSGGDALSLPELNQALSGLHAIIDVILVDACSASMNEIAYEVRDYANILIGPEDLGYEPAPYQSYLSSLTNNSSISANAFAKVIVEDYINWCFSAINIQNATIAATDLTKMASLAAAVDNFALELKEKENPFHEEINMARSLTEGFQGPYADQIGNYVDLYRFAQLIHQYVPDEELQESADQLMTSLSVGNVIIAKANKARPNSNGLSIFFPDEIEKYRTFGDTYERADFAKDTLWNSFVKYHTSGCVLTIQTTQPSIPLEVDRDLYTTNNNGRVQVFVQPDYHVINITTYVSTGTGSRSVFTKWNGSDTSNPKNIFVNGTTTLVAEYQLQHSLTMNANLGTTDPDIDEHWFEALSTVHISAAAPIATSGEQFLFVGWTGKGDGSYSGSDNLAYVTMNGPINETAYWRHEYYLTVASQYGSPTPTSGWFAAEQSIIVSITSPVAGPTGTQYICTGWNGTGSVPASEAALLKNLTIDQTSSIAWNWKIQYRLAVNTDPAGLSPQPELSSAGPWYDEGTLLNCAAQNVSGKVFDHWTVKSLTTGQPSDWERGMNQIDITVDGPYEAIAHYVPTASWWENLQIILLLALGVMLTSITGVAWTKTHRRKGKKKQNIQPVEKGPQVILPNRITTGYEDLDNLLLGGIPKNYAVTLASISCDERDRLIKRFLEVGARKGETTFYIASDLGGTKALIEEFPSNFYLFLCNPHADAIIKDSANVFKLKGVESLTDISIALTSAIRKLDPSLKGPRRICIGLVSDVLLQHHAVQTRRWLTALMTELKSAEFTTLAVFDPEMHSSQDARAILDLFDGEINIYERETEEGLQKFIKIKRMYNQKYVECELPLRKETLER